jgi:dephospho-CoA kinase
VVVVGVEDPEIQIRRLESRNGFSREEAEKRIAAQMPVTEKKRRCTYYIDNSSTIEQTQIYVETLCKTIIPNRLSYLIKLVLCISVPVLALGGAIYYLQ